jgi:hypothetical protein
VGVELLRTEQIIDVIPVFRAGPFDLGERPLNKNHIGKLSKRFNVSPAVL